MMTHPLILVVIVAVFLTNVPFSHAEEKLQNSSRFSCPQPNKVVFHWTALPPEIQWNITTGEITGQLAETIDSVWSSCCPSLSFSYSRLSANSSKDIEISIRRDKSPHISLYFPVFSHTKVITQYQRPYIGLYYSPGPALVMPDRGEKSSLKTLLWVSETPWLILTAGNGLTLIFGVLMWLLERRKNTEEFPSDFPKGAGEGTWWAFVTMTTVGYGDKAPRTCCGRVVAVCWMFISIVVLGIYTANLTAGMTSFHYSEVTAHGKRVGISLGGKSFFDHEMNLGAKFEELPFEKLLEELNRPTLDALMFYDYVEAKIYIHKASQNISYRDSTLNPLSKWKLAKIYDVRFSIGISAAGNLTGPLDKFLRCLQRGVVDVIAVSKYERIRSLEEIEVLLNESSTSEPKWLTRFIAIGSIYLVAAVLLAGGGLWQKLTKPQETRVTNGQEGQPEIENDAG